MRLDATLLGRAYPIMRDRRHIRDGAHTQPTRLNGTDGGFTARARPFHEDIDFLHPLLLRGVRGLLGGDSGGIGRTLAAALEARCARARPRYHIPLLIAHRDNRVVERGMNVRLPIWNTLTYLLWPTTTRARLSG